MATWAWTWKWVVPSPPWSKHKIQNLSLADPQRCPVKTKILFLLPSYKKMWEGKPTSLVGIKPTVSCETLSAIWLVWWRKRTVETSPSAAKHLKKSSRASRTKKKLSIKKPVSHSLFRLEKKIPWKINLSFCFNKPLISHQSQWLRRGKARRRVGTLYYQLCLNSCITLMNKSLKI